MLSLILLVIFGAAVAFFAIQNTELVTLQLAQYNFPNIPLFYVMVGSLLVGILIAGVFYLVHLISSSLAIYGRDKKIKATEMEAGDLLKIVHQLELENERLKKDTGEPADDKSL